MMNRTRQPSVCLQRPVMLVWVFALGGALAAGPLFGASLAVNGAAAFEGDYGLQVTPGCGDHPFSVELSGLPAPTLPYEVTACTTITAEQTDVNLPGSLFRAGEAVVLGHQFSVLTDAPFTAVIDDALLPFAYVQDNSPGAETTYRARFYLHLDAFGLDPGEAENRLEHFVAYSADGQAQFRLVLVWNALLDENRLVLEARLDDGSWVNTSDLNEEIQLPSGWNKIEVEWRAGDGDGQLLAKVNDVPSLGTGLLALQNFDSRIDLVRWGAVDGVLELTTGYFQVDDFASWR